MPSSLVTHDHIDALLSSAIDGGREYELAPGIPAPFTADTATMLGRVLLLANAASIASSEPAAGALAAALAHSYVYRPVAQPVSPAVAARLADILDVQSSESGTWDGSLGQRACWAARPAGSWLGAEYSAVPARYVRPRAAA